MKVRAWLALALILCLTVSLAGCGSNDTAVYVQSVSNLTGMGGIAAGDRFPGMVVSENVTEIKKDSEKTVKEVLVKEGDDVNKGDKLFEYDTDELQLSLEKKQLELEQLNASIENYQQQIKELEKERGWASGSDKLQYTIQIQTAQVDMKEAELNAKAKQTEVTQAENLLKNATVVSPIKGRIQSINESGTDRNGNPAPYITIQEVGSYRVKGTIGELQRGSLREGDRVMQIRNNYDKNVFNGDIGTVEKVNMEDRTISVIFEDHLVEYETTELDELTLAYATTIHKSQGSEYPVVVIPVLMTHFVMLQRNLIYTGITRAKKICVLIGQPKALAYSIRNLTVSNRNTKLKERLRGEIEAKPHVLPGSQPYVGPENQPMMAAEPEIKRQE